MLALLKSGSALAGIVCIAIGSTTSAASALSAEVAKKCDALTAKAFPPRVVGNPAAGSAKGSAQLIRAYFSECVAKGGNMEKRPGEARPPAQPGSR
jgi:hypothetical protein